MTSAIVTIFVEIAKFFTVIITGILAFIFKYIARPLGNALFYVAFDIIWKQVIRAFLWDLVLKPMCIIGAQLAYLIFKSLYYGPFLERQVLFDGLLGPPRESFVLKHPFAVWIPTPTLSMISGAIFGLGIGMRNYLDLVLTAVRTGWYGPAPKLFHISGAMIEEPSEEFGYHHAWAPYLGAVTGLGVGWRTLTNVVLTAPFMAYYGPFPDKMVGLIKLPDALHSNPKPWDSPVIQALAFFFGCGIGVRSYVLIVIGIVLLIARYAYVIAYGAWFGFHPYFYCKDGILSEPDHTHQFPTNPDNYECVKSVPKRIVMGIAALTLGIGGIGFRNVANLVFVAVRGAYYGPTRQYTHFEWADFGEPSSSMTTLLGKTLGAILGLGLGWRNWLERLAVIFTGGCFSVWYLIRGAYFGVLPTLRASHGVVPGRSDAYSAARYPNVAFALGTIGAVPLGLILGVRYYADLVSSMARCSWYGAFPILLPEKYTAYPTANDADTLPFDAWLVIKSVGGLFIGWRSILNLVLSLFKFGAKSGVWISQNGLQGGAFMVQGFWRGVNASAVHCRDGLLPPPKFGDLPPGWRGSAFYVGAALSLGVGLRAVLNTLSAIIPAIWHGALPGWASFPDGYFMAPIKPTNYFSESELDVDLQVQPHPIDVEAQHAAAHDPTNHSTLAPAAGGPLRASDEGLLEEQRHAPTSGHGGRLETSTHDHDDQPTRQQQRRYEMVTPIGKLFGLVFGVIFGLKRVVDALAIMARYGIWYGGFPEVLDFADSPLHAAVGPPRKYHHWTGALLGSIGGAVFGIRFLFLFLGAAAKGLWYGAAPARMHIHEGLLSKPAAEGIWRSASTPVFGVFGAGIGARAVLNVVTAIPSAAWYGVLSNDWYIEDGLVGSPHHQMESYVSVLLGATFGLLVGWRNILDVVFLVMRGVWWGSFPMELQLIDAPKGVKISTAPPRLVRYFGIFGLGIGLYPIVVALAYFPIGFWRGAAPALFSLPPVLLDAGGFDFKLGITEPSTVVSRLLGIPFGAVIGFRFVLELFCVFLIGIFQGLLGLMIGSDFSKNIEDPVWVRVVRTIVAIGCVDTIAIASLGIFAHPPGHAWHDSPVVITLSVTSFVAAAGIINVFRPRFWYALILSIRDTVLVIVGAALYFPVFVVILLVTNHYRCVLHLGRYITSPGSSPRTGTAAARAALSLVVTWGSFAAAYIIAHPLLPMIKTVAVSLGALCVMNAVTVVVLRQFNQSLFIISGWPIETSTRLPETEIRAINTHFTTSIHLAKHGKRTDPLKEIRFYLRDFGLVSPDERKLKVMYELFLEGQIDVHDCAPVDFLSLCELISGVPGQSPPLMREWPASDIDDLLLEVAASIPLPLSPTASLHTQESDFRSGSSGGEDMGTHLPPPPPPLQPIPGSTYVQRPAVALGPINDAAPAHRHIPGSTRVNPVVTLGPIDDSIAAHRPHPGLDDFPDAASGDAPPAFSTLPQYRMAARPEVSPTSVPQYEDLGPMAVEALDAMMGEAVFALSEFVVMYDDRAEHVVSHVLRISFEDSVDLGMISRGFKPRTLVVRRSPVVDG